MSCMLVTFGKLRSGYQRNGCPCGSSGLVFILCMEVYNRSLPDILSSHRQRFEFPLGKTSGNLYTQHSWGLTFGANRGAVTLSLFVALRGKVVTFDHRN